MTELIMDNIQNIYENININKALFVIKYNLLNDIKEKLIQDEYPVCSLKESYKFVNDTSRILLINNIEMDELQSNIELIEALKIINVIIFIETPILPDKDFYKLTFDMNNLNNHYIFQL